MQLTNSKKEKLYKFIIVDSNDFTSPVVSIKTWEEAIQQLRDMTVEKDNDEFLVQVVHKEVKEDYDLAKAILRINHKGWGGDYFRSIIVEPAFYHG